MLKVTAVAGDAFVTLSDGEVEIDIHREQMSKAVADLLMALTCAALGNNYPLELADKETHN